MTNDSGLFRTAAELKAEGFYPVEGNSWKRGASLYVPLYEGKMVNHFDHRFADAIDSETLTRSAQAVRDDPPGAQGGCRHMRLTSLLGTSRGMRSARGTWRGPLATRVPRHRQPQQRSHLCGGVHPAIAAGNKLPLLLQPTSPIGERSRGLAASLCAFAVDYVARQKIGSRTANWFAVAQLPVLPPSRYEDDYHGVRLAGFIFERVLELTYTAHDIAGFAEDMGLCG